MIQYQSYPETVIQLGNPPFTDDKQLQATFAKIFYKSGGKRTDLALNSTLDVFKAAKIRSGSKVVILITGGPSSEVFLAPGKSISGEDLLGMPTAQLHKAEVAVYAVGVQEGLADADKKTLTKQLGIIASTPTSEHVFELADFATVLKDAPKIANKSCIGKFISSISIMRRQDESRDKFLAQRRERVGDGVFAMSRAGGLRFLCTTLETRQTKYIFLISLL